MKTTICFYCNENKPLIIDPLTTFEEEEKGIKRYNCCQECYDEIVNSLNESAEFTLYGKDNDDWWKE